METALDFHFNYEEKIISADFIVGQFVQSSKDVSFNKTFPATSLNANFRFIRLHDEELSHCFNVRKVEVPHPRACRFTIRGAPSEMLDPLESAYAQA
jgi:hypothetical protein